MALAAYMASQDQQVTAVQLRTEFVDDIVRMLAESDKKEEEEARKQGKRPEQLAAEGADDEDNNTSTTSTETKKEEKKSLPKTDDKNATKTGGSLNKKEASPKAAK